MAVASLALAACGSHAFAYEPVTTTSAQLGGRPAAEYPIPLVPLAASSGDVRVATSGVVEMRARGRATERCLALTLLAENRSNTPWRVDTRVQAVMYDDGYEARAAYAAASAGDSPPIVTVPAQGTRTVDLFFPLPPGVNGPENLPRFDAVWSVQTPERRLSGRTPFARGRVEARAYEGLGTTGRFDALAPGVVETVRLEGPHLYRRRR